MKQYSNKLTPSGALAGSQLDNGDVIINTPLLCQSDNSPATPANFLAPAALG